MISLSPNRHPLDLDVDFRGKDASLNFELNEPMYDDNGTIGNFKLPPRHNSADQAIGLIGNRIRD